MTKFVRKKFRFAVPIQKVEWELADISIDRFYAAIAEPFNSWVIPTKIVRGLCIHRKWNNKHFQQFGDRHNVPEGFMPVKLPNERYLYVRASGVNKQLKLRKKFKYAK